MLAEGLGRPDHAASYAARIVPEVRRLGRVVTNMLDLSRLERGAPLASPAAGDPGPEVAGCVERLRGALEGAGMEVRLRIDADLPRALFDHDALCQILDNLLDNAEKYSRGSATRWVAVTAARASAGVRAAIPARPARPARFGRVGRGTRE